MRPPTNSAAELHAIADAGIRLERISAGQFEAMIDRGILPESKGLELVDGLLVRNAADRGDDVSFGQRHFYCVKRVTQVDRQLEGRGCHLQVQLPIALSDDGQPEPDGAFLRGAVEDYATRKPTPADVASVIEVSDSTLVYDRSTKLKTYARAGIPQYVIINLVDGAIELYEHPDPAAETYASPTIVPRDGTVTFRLFDGQTLDVPAASLLP